MDQDYRSKASDRDGTKAKVTIKEISCKSALQPSGLEGLDYSLNPYRGCLNACRYCYSPAILREEREWGTFVDVRRNMPQVLAKEIKKKEKGVVGISTVTAPYQPVERELQVTRHCLEVLMKKNWPVSIQTKSSDVGHDIDIIKHFSKAEVGMTVTSADDEVRRMYEPMTSPVEEQFQVLGGFHEVGVHTWVFIGPIIPFVTEETCVEIVNKAFWAGVQTVMVDGLRKRGKSWTATEEFIREWRPELLDKFQDIRKKPDEYFMSVAKTIEKACRQRGIHCQNFVGSDKL